MEYRIAKGWRIASIIVAAFFIAGSIALLYNLLQKATGSNLGVAIMLCSLFSAGAIALVYIAFKLKVVINESSIRIQRAFSNKEYFFDDLQGYRIMKGSICLLSKDGCLVGLSRYLERPTDFKQQLSTKINDVDEQVIQQETLQILNDEQFGFTREERQQKLAAAQRTAMLLNTTAVANLFLLGSDAGWLWYIPLLVLPAAIIALWRHSGLLTLNIKASAYPTVIYVFIAVPVILTIRASRYNITGSLLYYIAAVSVLLYIAVLIVTINTMWVKGRRKLIMLLLMPVSILFCSYGVVSFANCNFDDYPADIYTITVNSKQIYKGSKSNTYYVNTSGWGQYFTEGRNNIVSRKLYDAVNTGDTMHVYVKKGKLGAGWYFFVTGNNSAK